MNLKIRVSILKLADASGHSASEADCDPSTSVPPSSSSSSAEADESADLESKSLSATAAPFVPPMQLPSVLGGTLAGEDWNLKTGLLPIYSIDPSGNMVLTGIFLF